MIFTDKGRDGLAIEWDDNDSDEEKKLAFTFFEAIKSMMKLFKRR